MQKLGIIFETEVYAIEICAEFNLDGGLKRRDWIILYGSQNAIKALGCFHVFYEAVWKNLIRHIGSLEGHVRRRSSEYLGQLAW